MKKCTECKKEKDESKFQSNGYRRPNKKGVKILYKKSVCMVCFKARVRKKHFAIISEHFGGYKCADCGHEGHPASFDCHHSDPATKSFNIASAKRAGCSKERLIEELNKCELLCSNCHRIRHAKFDKNGDDILE